ncbi:IS110 family transposase [Peribacillus sp. Bi134]|uniref:IS110 family transposase n=1 Tax=Peribacillus TaxID=2675229 RepID=UPI001D2746B4|nr:IS110 family transposase [Peribacillus sp. Bi134]CAH0315971.1 hypothetical protein SRABI134_05309 [Peribacillus sp. Bi134]
MDSIPRIATQMVEQILAEIGKDVEKQFESAARLCSLTALVPEHNEVQEKGNQPETKREIFF